MKQKITTPDILNCFCGSKARIIDYNWIPMGNLDYGYRVECNNNHNLTRCCGTVHRAICKWNNAIIKNT